MTEFDPDWRHDAERNGDLPPRIDRLIDLYTEGPEVMPHSKKHEDDPKLAALEAEKAAIIEKYEVAGHAMAEERKKELDAVEVDIELAKQHTKKGSHGHG